MTLSDFKILVETFGANSARWPEDRQAEAQNFMRAHPEAARDVLQSEAGLDDLLETGRMSPGTDMLKARIKASVITEPVMKAPIPRRSGFGHKAVAALMLASFAVGFGGANYFGPSESEFITELEDDTYTASNEWTEFADDYGMSEIYEWVDAEDDL